MATCRFSGSEPEVVALCWHQSEKAWTVLFRAYLHGKHAPLAVIFEGGVCICTEMQCASSPSTSQRCRFVDILSGRSDRLNGLGVVSTLLRSRAGGMSGGAARLSDGNLARHPLMFNPPCPPNANLMDPAKFNSTVGNTTTALWRPRHPNAP